MKNTFYRTLLLVGTLFASACNQQSPDLNANKGAENKINQTSPNQKQSESNAIPNNPPVAIAPANTEGTLPPVETRKVSTTCWQMTAPVGMIIQNKQAWKLLGKCDANFAIRGDELESVGVESPHMSAQSRRNPTWNGASVKPHWNPAGEWMHCLWHADNSAICAVVP